MLFVVPMSYTIADNVHWTGFHTGFLAWGGASVKRGNVRGLGHPPRKKFRIWPP